MAPPSKAHRRESGDGKRCADNPSCRGQIGYRGYGVLFQEIAPPQGLGVMTVNWMSPHASQQPLQLGLETSDSRPVSGESAYAPGIAVTTPCQDGGAQD